MLPAPTFTISTAANPVAHSNVASGSLRGSFGVEPVYDLGNPEFRHAGYTTHIRC